MDRGKGVPAIHTDEYLKQLRGIVQTIRVLEEELKVAHRVRDSIIRKVIEENSGLLLHEIAKAAGVSRTWVARVRDLKRGSTNW